MTTYKVSDLTGALLDAAVALAEGMTVVEIHDPDVDDRGRVCEGVRVAGHPACRGTVLYSPTMDYRDGRDIIKREGIVAATLVAGLRAYVASKFGDTIDLDMP